VTPPHPIQRLYLAEDLVRRRRADEHRRYAASQRGARIDPNPHQIDAVIFALARLPTGAASSRTRSAWARRSRRGW
jgi:hypothetical protein